MVQKIIDAWHRHQQRVYLRDVLDATDGGVHEDILALTQREGMTR